MQFINDDIKQFQKKGITLKDIEEQLNKFKKEIPTIDLVRAATINDGIKVLSNEEINKFEDLYKKSSTKKMIAKFSPASGAATRMFKALFEDLKNNTSNTLTTFVDNIKKFACYNDLAEAAESQHISLSGLINKKKFAEIADLLLTSRGLNYSNLPKALIKFHQLNKLSYTALEEHIMESIEYCMQSDSSVNLHFTVSDDHYDEFVKLSSDLVNKYEALHNIKITINFSIQKENTDTIAVDLNNLPFRIENGSILFRPGGHGALLYNLNTIDADIVFVKNIDNIPGFELKPLMYKYKRVLAGYFLEIQNQIFEYLHKLTGDSLSDSLLNEIINFLHQVLCVESPDNLNGVSIEEKQKYCYSKLNRPLRICGMVKNDGDPGGGPFWVKNGDGSDSLQILESSQINFNDIQQNQIFKRSTHFNPVDIVFGSKNFKNEKFNLFNYRDSNTYLISTKNYKGKVIKSLELPGLWNGAMANWNTVFVEVPANTFHPVKTIMDLLNDGHLN